MAHVQVGGPLGVSAHDGLLSSTGVVEPGGVHHGVGGVHLQQVEM